MSTKAPAPPKPRRVESSLPPRVSSSDHVWLAAAILGVLVAAAFGRLVTFDFINYDDHIVARLNIRVSNGLSLDGLKWAFTTLHHANWHPFTWLSLQLDTTLYGESAAGHHFTNVLLHLGATLCLFAALARMTGQVWTSCFAAAIYALHPLHVQSAAWIGDRKGILCDFFFMLALWCYARYAQRPSVARYAAMFAAYVGGLFSKQMVITLPAALLLLDLWPLARVKLPKWMPGGEPNALATWKWPVLEKLPMFALSILFARIAHHAQFLETRPETAAEFPLAMRLAHSFVSYAVYLRKFIWPNDLAIFYPHPRTMPAMSDMAITAIVLGVLALASLWALGRKNYLFVGWWWYVGTLIPVIGIYQIGVHLRADRYMDVPLVGLAIIAAWGWNDVADWLTARKAGSDRLKVMLPVAAVALLFGLSVCEVSYWRDSESLFSRDVEVAGKNDVALFSLGSWWLEKGRPDLALPFIEEGLRHNPKSANLIKGSAHALMQLGRRREAKPFILKFLEMESTDADMRINLGLVLIEEGRLEEAAEEFLAARNDQYMGSTAMYNLGLLRNKQGRPREAIEALREAAKKDAKAIDARMVLARTLVEQGEKAEAARLYEEVLRLDRFAGDARRELNALRAGRP